MNLKCVNCLILSKNKKKLKRTKFEFFFFFETSVRIFFRPTVPQSPYIYGILKKQKMALLHCFEYWKCFKFELQSI